MRALTTLMMIVMAMFAATAMAAAVPDAQIVPTTPDVLIGDEATFCVTFRNTGNARGYGPFIDLKLPIGGIDGAPTCDGLKYVSAVVTGVNPNVPLTPEAPTPVPPCSANAVNQTHPYAANGVLPVPLAPGEQLVTLALPFGSFEPSQPEIKIKLTVQVNAFADDKQPLSVKVRGGFRFGLDPLNNGSGDPPILQTPWSAATITPHAMRVTKTYKGAEDEIVAGPSFASQFEIAVDVAPAHTVTNVLIHDCASAGTVFTNIVPPATNNGSCFDLTIPSLTGNGPPSAPPEAIVMATFYAGAALSPVAPACSTNLLNKVSVQATWTPLDPNDGGTQTITELASKSIAVKAIAIRKSVAIVPSPFVTPVPGARLRYTLKVEVSAYARFGDLVVEDTLSTAQLFQPSTARLSAADRFGSVSSIPFPSGTMAVTQIASGTYRCPGGKSDCGPMNPPSTVTLPRATLVRFLVSNALLLQGTQSFAQGILTGDEVAPPTGPAATATIVFDTLVQQTFVPPALAGDDNFVDKDDPILNHAQLTARRRALTPILNPPVIGICRDDTKTCLAVPGDDIKKEVVAKNGSYLTTIPAPLAPSQFQRGDTITFRITKNIPSGDAREIVITDWFAQPALPVATPFTGNVPLCGSLPPGVDQACYSISPGRTWTSALPAFVTPPAPNALAINFGSFQGSTTTVTIIVEVTLQISNDPMADELLLTNEAQECESTSYGTLLPRVCRTAIAQFQVLEPRVRILKGIVCTPGKCPVDPVDPNPIDNPSPERAAIIAGPIVNCALAATCPRFSGVVNSTNVATFVGPPSAIADAGDRATFVVVVENLGHGPNGAFDVTVDDVLDPEWTLQAGTLCVRRGDGATMTFQTTGGGFPITFTDNNTTGALDPWSATSGTNIAVLIFDAKLGPPSQVVIGTCPQNLATLVSYSNMDNGTNFVTWGVGGPFQAIAKACIYPKALAKVVVTSSEPHTPMTPAPPKLTIGEIVTYRLTFVVPEGTTTNFHVADPLPGDLQFIGTPSISTSGVNTTLTWTPVITTPNVDFNLGTVKNNDNDPDCERIVIQFNALVLNTNANNAGDVKHNSFSINTGGPPIATSPTVDVAIVEPKLTVTKTALVTHGLASFTVTVTNTSNTTAFDVTILDAPQGCLQNLTVINTSVTGGATPPTGTNPMSVASIPPGGTITITYHAAVACKRCHALGNDVTVRWTSLPLNGTLVNPTGSVTPGPSGTTLGERDGTTTPAVNDYVATASASLCGRVCGMKFLDANGNHLHDAGEAGLPGWTIAATDTNGNVMASTVTGANGAYCLDLLPGTYQLCETPQPGWSQTFPNPSCHTVVITTGTTVQPRDFGNRECWARVCGRKFETVPGTNTQTPLSGWTIVATPANGGPPISTTTDANGHYCLDLPGPGSWTVSEVQQTGWTQQSPTSYTVIVECLPSPTGTPGTPVVMGGVSPQALDFKNVNVCKNTKCPAPLHCIAIDGQPKCVP